jgi:zinc finger RNA-binding protein
MKILEIRKCLTTSAFFLLSVKEKGKEEICRELKGVMRVGLLAKGLLLRGDTDVKLIVICTNKPTKRLLDRVYKALLEKIEIVSPQNKYSVILDKDAETILVVKLNINELQPLITCRILLTSALVREQSVIKAGIYQKLI